MEEKSVIAVVVTYNRKDLLTKCIDALQAQRESCHILIVDNASTDGTETYIKENHSLDVQYINTGTNLGGAGGFNFGMKKALELGYEYIWIMDDDCLPKVDALQELLIADTVLGGKYGWLSSLALWTDGSQCKMNRQKVYPAFIEESPLLAKGLLRASQATFVSLFIKAETIRTYGLPIKDFFIWGDDVEYTRRIAVRGGVPSFIVGKSQVIHAMASNDGSDISCDCLERLSRYVYAYRNEAYLYRQEGIKGICYYLAKVCFNVYKIIRWGSSCRWLRLAILFKGFFMGLRFHPIVEFIEK